MKNAVSVILTSLVLTLSLSAQNGKKHLNHDAIEKWKRITQTLISPDGKFIAYKQEPWRGDSEIFLYNSTGDREGYFKYAGDIEFTADSRFLIYKTVTPFETLRELKLKKNKEDQMPGDVLNVYNLDESNSVQFEEIVGYKVPQEWGGYLLYQAKVSESGKDVKEKEIKKESEKEGFKLNLISLIGGDNLSWPFVTDYAFAKEEKVVVFVSTGDDNEFAAGIYKYDINSNKLSILKKAKGDYKQVTISEDGEGGAFLFGEKTGSSQVDYGVYAWSADNRVQQIVSNSSEGLPSGWVISANENLRFDNNRGRLFFGSAPEQPEKDTMRLDDEYPDVDIWHGAEGKLHTVQIFNRNRDSRKAYLAVYHFDNKRVIQLETVDIPEVSLIDKGNSNTALGLSNVPYQLQAMWESSPLHYDVYLVDIQSGKRKMIKEDIRARVQASPKGNYLMWYNFIDSSYYSFNISSGEEKRLTEPSTIAAANEINDVPNFPRPYRFIGWLKDDKGVLVNDRYDIWKIDPDNTLAPENVTLNGRTNRISYSYVSLDPEEKYIDIDKPLLLTGQNDITRESFYFTWDALKPSVPKQLLGGAYSLSRPMKAKNGKTIVFTKSTFNVFPDLLVTDLKFKKSIRISDANPQQSDYFWGTVELVNWTSLDGRKIEGLLYKPENFDPSVKYPMIVNFYEKSSQGLFNYRTPELHRSTIDYHYYTSNGYMIFNPDVYYEDGYPGESAFNCVMPGVTSIIERGFVDKNRIGAQGHSWGGYQVAYLATRTDLFAAIESGAPVVNMFSAYGGIRWGSGLNRSFQYEHTQSRIGATIWESPLRYLENSPLFTMDKVTTPILIMHNDEDGAVPWYQGIEYFVALRRLRKPVWMLNYTGEPHWPTKLKNKKDFQIRLAQFFDHYLKGKPMPKWMKEGVPVIKKEYDLGYELVKE